MLSRSLDLGSGRVRRVHELLSIKSWAELLVRVLGRWDGHCWQDNLHQQWELDTCRKNAFPRIILRPEVSVMICVSSWLWSSYSLTLPAILHLVLKVDLGSTEFSLSSGGGQRLIKRFLVLRWVWQMTQWVVATQSASCPVSMTQPAQRFMISASSLTFAFPPYFLVSGDFCSKQ